MILWVAGGASRADVSGQFVVRFFAWAFLIIFTLFATRLEWQRIKPVAIFLALVIFVVALQLVPLPPAIWTALPGRELLTGAAEVSGQAQPWRPLSISPGATANALGSLVVPAAVLVLCAQLTREQEWYILGVILGLVLAGCLLAMLQFSGASFSNPFINYQTGNVSGNFANRNHFALFVALGCLLAPLWGFRRNEQRKWKAIVAVGLIPLFLLVTLATGSRAGMILASLATVAGLALVRTSLLRALRALPRWGAALALVSALVLIVGGVVLSFVLGRAIAIERALGMMDVEDLRSLAMPYVAEALGRYFPAGAGFGTFDAAFRIIEPDVLLQPQYFNHAHNDWLEVALDGGIAGVLLLVASVAWVGIMGHGAWRRTGSVAALPLAGATFLFLIMLASVPDYPARTPMMMALIVITALWLYPDPRPQRS